MAQRIHDFEVRNLNGEAVPLKAYAGKVLLIVNTASHCGLAGQLRGLEELRREFGTERFEVLGFPSADFKGQEPYDGAEIEEYCSLNYDVRFPLFEKSHVIGPGTSDLYRFLRNKKANGAVSSRPRWNYHKYLVDADGYVRRSFLPITPPKSRRLRGAIAKLLAT